MSITSGVSRRKGDANNLKALIGALQIIKCYTVIGVTDVNKFADEFRDVLDLYVKLTADLNRIADVGKSDDDPQALIQSILDNRSCLTEIEQLNKRLMQLYGAWKEAGADLSDADEMGGIDSVIDNVRRQMQELEKLCGLGIRKIEDRRKQLSDELSTVGKGSRYLKMIKPVQENFPKFIDSAC